MARLVRRQHAVGSDDAESFLVADDEVVAVRVELVDVEPFSAVEAGPQFLGEHLEAQSLRVLDGRRVGGQSHGEARVPPRRCGVFARDDLRQMSVFHAWVSS